MASHKSPLFIFVLSFAAGIALAAKFAAPNFVFFMIFGSICLTLLLIGRKRILPRIEKAFNLSLITCFGLAGWHFASISKTIPDHDPSKLSGLKIQFEGLASEAPQSTKRGHKMVFEAQSPARGRMMLYFSQGSPLPKLNDLITFEANVTDLSKVNEGYANWLIQQGIYSTASVSNFEVIGNETGFLASLKSFRQELALRFDQMIPNANHAGLAKAMLLGDRSSLDPDLRTDFSGAGLSHVLAISGMHLGILYAALLQLLNFMCYVRNGKQIRAIILVIVLAAFAVFTGGNPAICRAAIMFAILELGQSFFQKSYSLNALAFAGLIFLCFDPTALYTPGFQLSYAAVIGIVVLQNPIRKYFQNRIKFVPNSVHSAIAVTLSAQIATAPLVAFHFQTFPTYFLFSNLVLLPLVLYATKIGFAGFVLVWIPGINTAWAGIMDLFFKLLSSSANIFAELPGATISKISIGESGLWILLAQTILILGNLERKFIQKATRQIFTKSNKRMLSVARNGLQMRLFAFILGIFWLLGGFVI